MNLPYPYIESTTVLSDAERESEKKRERERNGQAKSIRIFSHSVSATVPKMNNFYGHSTKLNGVGDIVNMYRIHIHVSKGCPLLSLELLTSCDAFSDTIARVFPYYI